MTDHAHPLAVVSLVVADVRASVAFYRTVGLTIPDDAIYAEDGVGHHVSVKMANGVTLDIDSVELTRRYDPGVETAPVAGRTLLSFATVDRPAVDALHDTVLEAGYRSHLAPFDAFWGARYAVVLDPDGTRVGISSPTA
jgi:uncharacterized glyoxalase superfamily protein PhnB